jgi:hypothetical protein
MSDSNEEEKGGWRFGRGKRSEPRKPLFPEDETPLEDEDPHARFRPPAKPEMLPEAEQRPEATPVRAASLEDDDRFPPLNPEAAQPKPPAPRQRSTLLPNLLAIFFFFATIGAGVYVYLVARDPYSPLNPFPPFTPVPIYITTTPLPPTITPTSSPVPTATFTPIPREVLATLTTWTPAPFPFTLAENGVVYVPNANEQGCNWSSIAGSVTGLQGEALDNYRVQVIGDNFNQTVITGSALMFGPGGYEMPINNVAQRAEFAVQLLTPEGIPISEVVYVETSDICNNQTQENVTIVSFVQNRAF